MKFRLAAWALGRRELQRFWGERSRVAGYVASPLLFWVVVGSGFGDLEYFFAGALTMTVMFSAMFSMMSLIEDRREGFLLSVLVSPAPRAAIVLGKVGGRASLELLKTTAREGAKPDLLVRIEAAEKAIRVRLGE